MKKIVKCCECGEPVNLKNLHPSSIFPSETYYVSHIGCLEWTKEEYESFSKKELTQAYISQQ